MARQIMPLELDGQYLFDFSQGNLLRTSSKEASSIAVKLFIEARRIATIFGEPLSPLQADLIDIALACYVADRLARRKVEKKSSRFQWSRNLSLRIGVRTPAIWSSEILEELSELLHLLTDDQWNFEMVPIDRPQKLQETQGLLFPLLHALVKVSLYSGGLDSYAGAVQEVSHFQDHSFVFVSGATNSRQVSAQSHQINAIKKFSSSQIHHISIPFGIKREKEFHYIEEPSQRSRGFLFLTLGVVAALKANLNTLHLYENGVGAINLPYNASQQGAMNSRSTHPLFLLRMEMFLNKILGEPFQIINPFLFHTKGEMCKHQAMQFMAQCIPSTFSCDGFPVRQAGKPQCGSCTSCLLRRLSLEIAGLSAFDDGN